MINQSVVRTLLGAGSFESSVTCLRSLVACTHESIQLIVHDDGTLTPEHHDRLRSEVDSTIKFMSRQESDDLILPQIAKYPACLQYRRIAPLAMKLFDTSMVSDGPLNFVDSDVYFRRSTTKLFDSAHAGSPVFMDNITNSYAIRPWHSWPLSGVRLTGRLNTGIIVGWTEGIDLEFVEWLLNRLSRDAIYRKRLYWIEQTCWAALAERTDARLFDSRQIVMASPTMNGVTPEWVAIHFVSTYRSSLANYLGESPAVGPSPVEVRTVAASAVSALGLFCSDLHRRLHNPVK